MFIMPVQLLKKLQLPHKKRDQGMLSYIAWIMFTQYRLVGIQ